MKNLACKNFLNTLYFFSVQNTIFSIVKMYCSSDVLAYMSFKNKFKIQKDKVLAGSAYDARIYFSYVG